MTARVSRTAPRLRGEHAGLPLAPFGLDPRTAATEDIEASRHLDATLVKLPELKPVAIGVFWGAVDPTRLRFPFNRMPATAARDWETIGPWTAGLGSLLARAAVTA
jgi:hypothetical protein